MSRPVGSKRTVQRGKAAITPALADGPSVPVIDERSAIDRVLRLMAVPGKSGEEASVVAEIRRELLAAGVPESCIEVDDVASRSPIGGDSGNLIVRLPGTMRGPRRLLMAHVDTVPLCVGCRPTGRSIDPSPERRPTTTARYTLVTDRP